MLFQVSQSYLELGFDSVRECLHQRFSDFSPAFVRQLQQSATLYLTLDPQLQYLDKVSVATFRPLAKLNDEQVVTLWHQVLTQYAHKHFITVKNIMGAARTLGIEIDKG